MVNSTIEQVTTIATDGGRKRAASDEDLLLRYRARGDRWAFDQLVHRYEKELYGYLRNYLGDAQLAEDVFQQTFLQVHLKCDQFEPGRRVRPWLYTVATNQAIDTKRRQRRHRMVSLDRRGQGRLEEAGGLVELLDSAQPGPVEEAETSERSEEVRRAIERLPEQARQVVLLVYFQGLKYREAAEVLSIPVGTVKSRLHTAIAKLSDTLNRTRLPK